MPDPLELRLTVSQAEVLVEAPEHHRQVLLLIEALRMKMDAQPRPDLRQEPPATPCGRDPDHGKAPVLVPAAHVSEPEKLEPPGTFSLVCGSLVRKTPEHDELGLAVSNREMELPQPLRQRDFEVFRIRPILEAGNVVVGEADQAGLAPTLARKDPLEPQVEDVV